MSPCREPLSLSAQTTSLNWLFLVFLLIISKVIGGWQSAGCSVPQTSLRVMILTMAFFFFFLLPPPRLHMLRASRGSLTLPQSSRGEKSPSWRPSGGSCFKKCKMSTGAESEERARWIFHCSICSAFAIVGVQWPSRRCTGLPASVQMSYNWILYPLNVNQRLFVLIKERALGGKRESVCWNLTFWNIKGPILWKIHSFSTGNMCLWHVGELSRN